MVNGYRESDGKISVADLEKGLYILQINAGEFRQTEKFIVK
ncbi:MAG: T9SS type A sorting domain-containing protein [Bacteroidales bacterium]|nr:T9SS type A sorting domain-containing protein [Bacteroidales bacterium]